MESLAGLGPVREIALPQGTIRYHDVGSDPALVFVHGIFVIGALWRKVVPALVHRFRCIVPDLPLGGHTHPLRLEADRSPRGVARLLTDVIAPLNLREVRLVGNDTGGAICQIAIADDPERITGLVLTNCDAYEEFFPWLISPLHYGARFGGERFGEGLALVLRSRLVQRALLWPVSLRRPNVATLDAYFGPFLRSQDVRRDLTRFLAAGSTRDTLAAAAAFLRFHHPVLIAWGESDFVFPARNARRLQREFPDAELRFIPHARTFVLEDQPRRLAALIAEFVPARVAAAA